MSSTSPTLPPDPFRGFNFLVSLVDSSSSFTVVTSALQSLALGGFSECSGLEMSMDIEEYSEGGNNGTVLRFPTRVKWTNLRLKRGVTFADELWQWHYDFSRGWENGATASSCCRTKGTTRQRCGRLCAACRCGGWNRALTPLRARLRWKKLKLRTRD